VVREEESTTDHSEDGGDQKTNWEYTMWIRLINNTKTMEEQLEEMNTCIHTQDI
jgi:hypothetical protein